MFGSENSKIIPLTIQADPGGSDKMFYLAKMPRAITVKAVWMTSELALGAGTAVKLRLENWGTAGTSVEGTVCAYIGGTADPLSARTPVQGTIDEDQDYIGAGKWLVAHYAEDGGGWQSGDRIGLFVEYVDGLGA